MVRTPSRARSKRAHLARPLSSAHRFRPHSKGRRSSASRLSGDRRLPRRGRRDSAREHRHKCSPSCGCGRLRRSGADARSGRSGGVRASVRAASAFACSCESPRKCGRRTRGSSEASVPTSAAHALAVSRMQAFSCCFHRGVVASRTASATGAGPMRLRGHARRRPGLRGRTHPENPQR